jgi:hypothetical protein
MFFIKHDLRWVALIAVTLGLVACSSGGGDSPGTNTGASTSTGTGTGTGTGGSGTTAPTLSLTPQSIKSFHFTWADVSNEEEYRLLENPDGSSGYTVVATIAADATSHDLQTFLPSRINARYILQACNSGGCSDSAAVFVSGALTAAVGYVKASNTGAGDWFGASIALAADGNTLAVGASAEGSAATGIDGNQADDSAPESGAVYLFSRNGSSWSQQAYLKASNSGAGDWFGYSVTLAADGNTLAVGSPNQGGASGAVYLFGRSGATWSEQAYLKSSNSAADDGFGSSVALAADGNTLAIGAVGEDSNATGIDGDQTNNTATNSGAVYLFSRNGSNWSQQAYVKASNTGTDDQFGRSVALAADGNTLAVGVRFEDSAATGIGGNQGNNSAVNSGAVYLFSRSGASWGQQAYLKAANTEAGDWFGYSVALAADGNTLAVGAPNEAIFTGAVYLFSRSGSNWSQQAYLKASNTGIVALTADGNTLAVGTVGEDSNATGTGGDQTNGSAENSGAVQLFSRSGGSWSEQAFVKAANTGIGDAFGYSVALAADGKTLAVGALGEQSSATGTGGNQADNSASASGAVYLY